MRNSATAAKPAPRRDVDAQACGMSGHQSANEAHQWAYGWRRLALSAGMLLYPVATAVAISQESSGSDAAVGFAIVAAFCCCYAVAIVAAARLAWRHFWFAMAAMTVLFLAALPFAHAEAFFLCAVVAATATSTIGRPAIPFAVLSVLAALVVPWAVRPWQSGPWWLQAFVIVCTVLMVHAFAETVRANNALLEARAEVARLASEAERARIARDLHDLLGHSLTAVAVKSELAARIAKKEGSASLPEISDVGKLSRQTLADVRAAISGYREVTLANELARAKELLRASGIIADLPTATDVVEPAHQELFGWVVREGVTNVARHARASRCTVTLSASAIEVRDDGVGRARTATGSGLAMLRERAALVGGSVEAGPISPRGWRLRVSVEGMASSPR